VLVMVRAMRGVGMHDWNPCAESSKKNAVTPVESAV